MATQHVHCIDVFISGGGTDGPSRYLPGCMECPWTGTMTEDYGTALDEATAHRLDPRAETRMRHALEALAASFDSNADAQSEQDETTVDHVGELSEAVADTYRECAADLRRVLEANQPAPMPWRSASNGAGKRHWFVCRRQHAGTQRLDYLETTSGDLVRFASMAAADRRAAELNGA